VPALATKKHKQDKKALPGKMPRQRLHLSGEENQARQNSPTFNIFAPFVPFCGHLNRGIQVQLCLTNCRSAVRSQSPEKPSAQRCGH
jgi:hypothetical protein